MKKRILTFLLIAVLAITIFPFESRAAVTPYFVIVNETLLPFNESTMPFVSGGEVFVPITGVLNDIGVWGVGDADRDFARVFRDMRYVDLHTRPGMTRTVNQDGIELDWPASRRVGRRFYAPLRQLSSFFGFTFQVEAIPREIIPERQMYAVRIVSGSVINAQTAIGMNRNAIREAYLEHFAPPSPSEPPQPGGADTPPPDVPYQPPPPPVEEPQTYEDVTVHLSFYNLAAGSAEWILDLFDIQVESGFSVNFFVSAEDIFIDPGIMRRIAGTGHTLGIWLSQGTFEEYLEISRLLFDAAKMRTVMVSASEAASDAAMTMSQENGLIFWDSRQSIVDYTTQSLWEITATIPRESGASRHLMFPCSEDAAAFLPGVYSFLRNNSFSVERITETVLPIPHNIGE